MEKIRLLLDKTPVVIEPGPDLAAACRDKSLHVVEKFPEDFTPDDLPEIFEKMRYICEFIVF